MRRRLRAPLITLGISAVALVAFAAVLNQGEPTNEVQAFAGQATETSAKADDTTTSTVEASTSTTSQQGSDRAAPAQARRTTVSAAITSPTTAGAAPTTAAPLTTAPTTAAPTAAPTTAAPTTAVPTTAAPTTTSTAPSGPKCDPNYSGCVPIASDVDCAGGSGNGPEYVQGPIKVIGTDIYGLDADDDGIACE